MFKTRTIATVLVAGGILIGAFLGGFLPDFTKPGLGPGEALAPSTELEPTVEKEVTPPELVPAPASDVVHVIIDGRDYFIKISDESYPASLEQVVELAQNAQGDEDGIRVRISRRSSSRTTAEMALRERLLSAGIEDEAIRWSEGLLP